MCYIYIKLIKNNNIENKGCDIIRELNVEQIITAVEEMCITACTVLGDDVKNALINATGKEVDLPKNILETLIENAKIAEEEKIPMCQDTGLAVFFIELGQDLHINGNLTDAINQGVRQGYEKGYLRKSVVSDPIDRINTKDNTPAIIHYNIVSGDKLKITFAPKGQGSENMSQIKMLKPSEGINGIKNFILDVVKTAGPNTCPPIVVGVGIGGTMEKCAELSKLSLLREIGKHNKKEYWAKFEQEMLEEVNKLNIGPSGMGGNTTALAVHVEEFACHIAGLPVAVNLCCHALRHATIIL